MLFWGAVVLIGFLTTLVIGGWGIPIFICLAIVFTVVLFQTTLGYSVLFLIIGLPVGLVGSVFGLIVRAVIRARRDDEE